MKIFVFSDSHKDVEAMYAVIYEGAPDAVLHLGDHASDILDIKEHFPMLEVHAVSGNCDYRGWDAEPAERHITLGNKKIFMAHGDGYGVKSSIVAFSRRARELGANIALFGHTHMPHISHYLGMWLMNPGHASRYTGSSVSATYGVLTIEGDTICCDIMQCE